MGKLFNNLDYIIPLVVLILIGAGLVLIGSATYSPDSSFGRIIFAKTNNSNFNW